MASTLLKRRLNPFLLATTVLILSILAALSVLYQGQLSELLQQKKSLNDTLEQKNRQIQDLRNDKANLTQKLENRREDIQTYLNENRVLRQRISSLNSTIDSLESEVSRLQGEVKELRGANKRLSDRIYLLNISLRDICSDDDTNLTATGIVQCQEWGHRYEGE